MDVFLLVRRAFTATLFLGLAVVAHAQNRCAAPDGTAGAIAPLQHLAAVLKPGGKLAVLTIGSATVFSPTESLQPGTVTGLALGLNPSRQGATDQPAVTDKAFPLQMARALQAAYPGLQVNVTVKGGRGMLASDMVDIVRAEMAHHAYQLVIWQTGTVEAVRNIPSGAFYQTLSDGASTIADAGADLVLVDPQFSRFLHANADLEPYDQALRQIAAQPNVLLFHRFDLMRSWANDGQIDLERTPKGQRLAAVEALHACLGEALAKMLSSAAKDPA